MNGGRLKFETQGCKFMILAGLVIGLGLQGATVHDVLSAAYRHYDWTDLVK